MWTERGRNFGLDVRAPAGAPGRDAAGQAAVRIAESPRRQDVTLATALTADLPPGYAPYEAYVVGTAPGRWAGHVAFGTGGQPVRVCATDRSLTREELARVLLSTRVTVATHDWTGD